MTRLETGSSPDWGDEHAMNTLRDMYIPPGEGSYWDALQTRIMARIACAPPAEWWSFFGGWVRVGVAAAAVAALIAGAAFVQSRDAEARLAYEAVMDAASGVPVAGPWGQSGSSATSREATLRYVMSY